MICINETQKITKEDIDRICKEFSKIKHKQKIIIETYQGVVKEFYKKYKEKQNGRN